MRRRIISAALALGLGAVTFALAQQGTERPKPRPSGFAPAPDQTRDSLKADRAKRQARVARLRAEVELLQLEHDAIGW
jgi:hypothetical protein